MTELVFVDDLEVGDSIIVNVTDKRKIVNIKQSSFSLHYLILVLDNGQEAELFWKEQVTKL